MVAITPLNNSILSMMVNYSLLWFGSLIGRTYELILVRIQSKPNGRITTLNM